MVNEQATNCDCISLQQRVLVGAVLTRNLKPALNCTELSDPPPPPPDQTTGRAKGRRVHAKDGNGDPIPDSPRGIPLLGDGDGVKYAPTGI